jgi:hypothetical protein
VGNGACLGHVHDTARYFQPGRNDVVEGDELGDFAIERDPQNAVVVPIGDEKTAPVDFQRVLEPMWKVEGSRRRVVRGEFADVCNDRKGVGAVYPVDAVDVASEVDDVGRPRGGGAIGSGRDRFAKNYCLTSPNFL